jgi:outer membrane protein OmpA-like peptidoglycan-associated protein
MRRLAAIAILLLAAACAAPPGPQRQVVFFDEWSAALDSHALGVVKAAAEAAMKQANAPVTVIGYADPEGSPEANIAISRARAENVVAELVKAGLPAGRINRQARGATAFTGTAPVESRRVEIVIGAP